MPDPKRDALQVLVLRTSAGRGRGEQLTPMTFTSLAQLAAFVRVMGRCVLAYETVAGHEHLLLEIYDTYRE